MSVEADHRGGDERAIAPPDEDRRGRIFERAQNIGAGVVPRPQETRFGPERDRRIDVVDGERFDASASLTSGSAPRPR